MREKIQKLIDEGNAVTSTGLPYNMWLNHIEKFYHSENFNDKAIEDTIKQAKTFSNNSGWFEKHHPDLLSWLMILLEDIPEDSEINSQSTNNGEESDMNKDVFIVYAHKGEAIKLQVQDFIQNTLKFTPHTLDISKYTGSIWDAFVKESQICSKAIVVMTADDEIHDGDNKYYQSRPNVFIELGYLIHKCSLDNVTIVSNGDVEMPTDISGIIHVKMDNPNWKESIRNQMDR